MEQLRNKLKAKSKNYRIGIYTLVAFALGITAMGSIGACFGNFVLSGIALAGLTFVAVPFAIGLEKYGQKIDDLKFQIENSSINNVTECETDFETEEYKSNKETDKDTVVTSPKEVSLEEINNKHKKEYDADISL